MEEPWACKERERERESRGEREREGTVLGKRDVETAERGRLGGAGDLSENAEVGHREKRSWEGREERERDRERKRKALKYHLSQPHWAF